MLRKLLGLSALVGGMALPAGAQPGHPHGPAAELRKEEREYVKTKVVPALHQQRQQLEQELAPADRTQLATYRAQLKSLAKRELALHQAAWAARPAAPDSARHHRSHPAPTPEMQAARTERREIMQQVDQLAQKYQANIARIAAELKPQQTQWAADLRAIRQKNQPVERAALAPAPGGDAAAALKYQSPRFGHGLRDAYLLPRPAAFLLLDPGAAELPELASVATSLYPNPVAPISQLQYELKQAGPVTVQVLDKNGNALRTVLQAASQTAGPHTEALNLGDLPSGTYFYQVKTTAGIETKRFIKE